MAGIWHWILYITGAGNVSGRWYGFWSGFGSDISELLIFGGIWAAYRKNNCRARRCPRFGRHVFTDPRDGVERKLCWKHHPDVQHKKLTAGIISRIHRHRLAERAGAVPPAVPPD